MVYDLPLLGSHVEITIHFIIVEGADTSCSQPERLSGEIQTLANGAGFEMNVAITTISIFGSSAIEVTNHRKGHAGITGQSLSKTQSYRHQALVANLHLLQVGTVRPKSVDAGL